MLPERHFFTGAPGSRWSGISQDIESSDLYDTSDRTPERSYTHDTYNGHVGVYFGTGMEFPASLDKDVLDSPYTGTGSKLHKSHEYAFMLPNIVKHYPDCWITLVVRDSQRCFTWWKKAGGWDITYPNYDYYVDDETMMDKIIRMNCSMMNFAHKHNLTWRHVAKHTDILKTTWKP